MFVAVGFHHPHHHHHHHHPHHHHPHFVPVPVPVVVHRRPVVHHHVSHADVVHHPSSTKHTLKITSIALAIAGVVILPLALIALCFTGPAAIVFMAVILGLSGTLLLASLATGIAHLAIRS